ncbi:response regulator transcription factor [Diplocloster modestus]|uniref:Stage 0 sporulation protein A homolog n=1 Tax=Diplocloster modestus TaxID=2850322 RepID=A0ABS6K824_9FIRM|nr:response regulator [Diplocloster modestus]MBU9726660.1 response regulator [Diplocloster modestus]
MARLRIVVAEDEQRILSSIVSKIERTVEDCEVIATANDGEKALELVEKYHPHVIFSDIKMPKMDGIELARELRKKAPDIHVVLLSGYSDFSFARQAMRYGVSYYLVKPLVEEDLLEVIEEIRAKLEESRRRSFPQVRMSGRNSMQTAAQEPTAGKNGYYVLGICFYNLCCSGASESLGEFYTASLDGGGGVKWEEILEDLPSESPEWMIADGNPCNFKNIVLTTPIGQQLDMEEIVSVLSARIHTRHPGMKFNLCYREKQVKREDIWNYTHRIRNLLETWVVPAEEQVFVLENMESVPAEMELYDAASLRLQNNIKVLFKMDNYNILLEELMNIMSYVLECGCTQKQLVKIVHDIYKMLESSLHVEDQAAAAKVKEKFYTTLSIAGESREIQNAFSESVTFYLQDRLDRSTSQKAREEVMEYVDKNFMVINSVEEVAEKFNYNYTYVSRLFREMKGVSMIKYLTEKRIGAAQKIMKEKPNLSVNHVCNMVGYTDQHYFSRVFKASTGMSPKEYRKKVIVDIK